MCMNLLLAAVCRDVDAPAPTPGKRGRKVGFKLVRDNGAAESAKKVGGCS